MMPQKTRQDNNLKFSTQQNKKAPTLFGGKNEKGGKIGLNIELSDDDGDFDNLMPPTRD